MSFTDFTTRDLQTPFNVNLVGFENYVRLFQDPRFLRSALNTFIFVLVGVPLTMALALLVALALNKGIQRFRTVYRVGFYAPVVTSIVAIAIVWRFILQPDGLLNGFLACSASRVPTGCRSTTWALPSLIFMAVWRNIGTLMVIFLAGLQGVPQRAPRGGDGRRRERLPALHATSRSPRCGRRSCSPRSSPASATCSSSRSRT